MVLFNDSLVRFLIRLLKLFNFAFGSNEKVHLKWCSISVHRYYSYMLYNKINLL